MNNGKLIVIEGLDGCGKNTQTKLLIDYFKTKNLNYKYLSFPNYESPSSSLIKMYLNSEFGKNPNDVNPYAASSFYAVDRYASFKSDWEKDFINGFIIVCDRYTTSNSFYQLSKLENSLWDEYLTWLYDYEYNKLGLPKPSIVVYLQCNIQLSQSLMKNRYHGDESKKDIHESNMDYLKKCSEAANYVAKKDNWFTVNCCNGVKIKDKIEIHNQIINLIKEEFHDEFGV